MHVRTLARSKKTSVVPRRGEKYRPSQHDNGSLATKNEEDSDNAINQAEIGNKWAYVATQKAQKRLKDPDCNLIFLGTTWLLLRRPGGRLSRPSHTRQEARGKAQKLQRAKPTNWACRVERSGECTEQHQQRVPVAKEGRRFSCKRPRHRRTGTGKRPPSVSPCRRHSWHTSLPLSTASWMAMVMSRTHKFLPSNRHVRRVVSRVLPPPWRTWASSPAVRVGRQGDLDAKANRKVATGIHHCKPHWLHCACQMARSSSCERR